MIRGEVRRRQARRGLKAHRIRQRDHIAGWNRDELRKRSRDRSLAEEARRTADRALITETRRAASARDGGVNDDAAADRRCLLWRRACVTLDRPGDVRSQNLRRLDRSRRNAAQRPDIVMVQRCRTQPKQGPALRHRRFREIADREIRERIFLTGARDVHGSHRARRYQNLAGR